VALSRVDDGKLLRELKSPVASLKSIFVEVTLVAFSADGKLLASGMDDHTVRLWSTKDWKLLCTLKGPHTDYLRDLAFSPDGKHLASSWTDGTVKLWDVEAVSRQGATEVTTAYCSLRKPNPTAINRYMNSNSDIFGKEVVEGVAFSPDGNLLASCGYRDNCVRLWDVKDKKLLHTLKGHKTSVHSVAFSPDGKLLASGSGGGWSGKSKKDCTVRLWEVEGWKLLRTLEQHQKAITKLAFSPDGHLLASGSMDHTVRLWGVE
jgi:WD40 repeat protein